MEGEVVYIQEGIQAPAITKIRALKELMKKIVEVMGGEPETVNICVADRKTDGYNEDGQLFFNVEREDSALRWIVVASRELARNDKPTYWYKQSKIMLSLFR